MSYVLSMLQTSTKTRMDFDLSRFADFQLHFPGHQTAGECW